MIAFAVITVSSAAIIGLSSFISKTDNAIEVNSNLHESTSSQGKHCTGTVGCDCSGFSAKTGDVWEEAYCKKCDHHKKYHR